MTKELKNRIFQEYFRPAKELGEDIYCGDLSITCVGINSDIRYNPLCFEYSLEMEPLSSNFYYSDMDIMEGALDDEDGDDDDLTKIEKLLKGELKQWKLIEFIFSKGGDDEEHDICFTALRTDGDGYRAAGNLDEWYEQNTCSGMYFDHSNNFTLFSSNGGETAYLMHSGETRGGCLSVASFVEITEFICYHKTRFRRWFHHRNKESNSWNVTIWATE